MCCFLPASFAWGYFERLVFALSQVWLKRCNRISPNHHTKDNEKGAHLKKNKYKKQPATVGSWKTEGARRVAASKGGTKRLQPKGEKGKEKHLIFPKGQQLAGLITRTGSLLKQSRSRR